MSYSPVILNLIQALCTMPGIGKKSAQRIAFHLLEKDRGGTNIIHVIITSCAKDKKLQECRMLTDDDLCVICSSGSRDESTICVVESPSDVMAIEDATGFKGKYFILMGHLSPIDGIGPEELGLSKLEVKLARAPFLGDNSHKLTVEGDATAHLISGIL